MFRLGIWRLCASFALSFVLLQSTVGVPPQTAAANPQAVVLLQKALAAMVGNASISDVTLTGTARRIAGSDDESGPVTFQALSSGPSRILLNFSSGTRSEIHTVSDSVPSGSWAGPNGVARPIAQHNLIGEAGLFPIFTLASVLSNPNSVINLIALEVKNGQSVYHVSVHQRFPLLSEDSAKLMQHLSTVDLFLDPSTSLPTSISYNTHADNDALLDIPVEFQFSNFKTVSGVTIPMHIEKYLNNSLALDLQFESVSMNSGVTASAFQIQ